ncbi:MAG: hypothetical protein EAX90_07875 [Candidatus Heimdallarchaeota archaeon]|nr:hypothetical protein [Candidatus Heimdallarchaeota archaeon]
MSDDHESHPKIYNPRSSNELIETEFPSLDTRDNSIKNQELKQILAEIGREEALIKRQDVIEYRLNFVCVAQAVSIILIIFMGINAIMFLSVSTSGGNLDNLPMIMFAQAGVMFVFTGIMIPRRSFTVERSYRVRNLSQHRKDLRFAFTHSLTWLICALCMAIFSTIFYLTFNR